MSYQHSPPNVKCVMSTVSYYNKLASKWVLQFPLQLNRLQQAELKDLLLHLALLCSSLSLRVCHRVELALMNLKYHTM
jgi:hypothetical protein